MRLNLTYTFPHATQRTNFRFWIKYTQLIARRVHELNIFCEIFLTIIFRVIYQVTKQ
jgi:hypothetical protein